VLDLLLLLSAYAVFIFIESLNDSFSFLCNWDFLESFWSSVPYFKTTKHWTSFNKFHCSAVFCNIFHLAIHVEHMFSLGRRKQRNESSERICKNPDKLPQQNERIAKTIAAIKSMSWALEFHETWMHHLCVMNCFMLRCESGREICSNLKKIGTYSNRRSSCIIEQNFAFCCFRLCITI
jgi:hypothetical protein